MLRSRSDHAGKAVRHHVLPDVLVYYERHEGPNVPACVGELLLRGAS